MLASASVGVQTGGIVALASLVASDGLEETFELGTHCCRLVLSRCFFVVKRGFTSANIVQFDYIRKTAIFFLLVITYTCRG